LKPASCLAERRCLFRQVTRQRTDLGANFKRSLAANKGEPGWGFLRSLEPSLGSNSGDETPKSLALFCLLANPHLSGFGPRAVRFMYS
jgi:hypothetical protein